MTQNVDGMRARPDKPLTVSSFALPPLDAVLATLRSQRALRDASQRDVAKLSGLSVSMIAKLEAGKMNPSYESVRRLESAIRALAEEHAPRARDLMATTVVAVEPKDRVAKARQLMDEHDFSQLPVVQGGTCVGSISTSILFDQLVAGTPMDELSRQPVASVQGPPFPTVSLDSPMRALCALLSHGSMVIVMDRGEIQGVVSKSDLW